MLNVIVAFAAVSAVQAAPAPAPVAPAAAVRTLASIPGVTVTYYDVAGKNDKAIRESLAAQRPKGADGQPIAGSSKYNVGAAINKRTTGDKCTVTAANLTFTGTAELPRLTTESTVDARTLGAWRSYVAGLESTAATELAFIRDRLPQVQQAIVGKSCDEAGAAMTAALAKLKAEQAAARNAKLVTPPASGLAPVQYPAPVKNR